MACTVGFWNPTEISGILGASLALHSQQAGIPVYCAGYPELNSLSCSIASGSS